LKYGKLPSPVIAFAAKAKDAVMRTTKTDTINV